MVPRPPNRNDTHLRPHWRNFFSGHVWREIIYLDHIHKEICGRFVEIASCYGPAHPQEREEAETETDDLLERVYSRLSEVVPMEQDRAAADTIYPNGVWEDRYHYIRVQAEEIGRRVGRQRIHRRRY
jgi:hypothetical protein